MEFNVIRVFPRRTHLTPRDDYAFVGDPPMQGEMMRPIADEVHVSCTFTWDKPKAERLAQAWGQYYPIVKLGGPAYSTPVNGFKAGLYIREGVTFTSRGCNNKCPWCLVPEREGKLKLIVDFAAGYIVNDNNLLQCSQSHISRVIDMLKSQPAAVFSGGIEARLVTDWFAEQIRSITIHSLFLACDTEMAIKPLERAVAKLKHLNRRKLRCYVLIGKDENIEDALSRLVSVYQAGCLPFAQLYQPPDKWIEYSDDWKALQATFCRPAATLAFMGVDSRG